ncbi:MAG: hypothetical protein IIT32_00500, partial [Bacteroidales bacterium]|nr:hypothetical protein [Bacteroidales bacterium]
ATKWYFDEAKLELVFTGTRAEIQGIDTDIREAYNHSMSGIAANKPLTHLIPTIAPTILLEKSISTTCSTNTIRLTLIFTLLTQVKIFNPQTMTEISRIDVSNLRNEGVSAYPGAMYIRDGILYVALEQFNAQWMPNENSLEFALYNVSDDTFIKKIRNTTLGYAAPTRPIDNQSIFEDENGDLYFNCVGSFGYIPGLDSGIARIKKGSTEIDETYNFNLQKTRVEGLAGDYLQCIFMCRYIGGGKMYAYGYSPALDPTNTNTYTARTVIPIVVDIYNKSIKIIEGMPLSNGHGVAMGKHGNKMVYGSANNEYNGFSSVDLTTGEVETKIVTVEGFPSFFYSFE